MKYIVVTKIKNTNLYEPDDVWRIDCRMRTVGDTVPIYGEVLAVLPLSNDEEAHIDKAV